MKGLVLGLIGFSPIVIILIAAYAVNFTDTVLNKIKDAIVHNILLGPLYFSIDLFNKTTIGYIVSLLIIPFLCLFGYMMGFYGKTIRKNKKIAVDRKQELSPWNPARQDTEDDKKKKKKVKKANIHRQ